jgi:hypothetical protein
MKISPLSSPFSFLLDTKEGKVSVNETSDGVFSLFMTEQENDEKNILHWPGEYEKNGVAAYLVDLGGERFLGKMHAENMNFAFLSSGKIKNLADHEESFGAVDILLFEKGEDGPGDAEMKKFLETLDPRVVIFVGEAAKSFAQKSGFAVEEKTEISISRSSLPSDKTEFYGM